MEVSRRYSDTSPGLNLCRVSIEKGFLLLAFSRSLFIMRQVAGRNFLFSYLGSYNEKISSSKRRKKLFVNARKPKKLLGEKYIDS